MRLPCYQKKRTGLTECRFSPVPFYYDKGDNMIKRTFLLIGLMIVLCAALAGSSQNEILPAPNGITLPEGFKDWRVIASSHRTDNNTLRVILGNDVAIEAAREGMTNPWPDGALSLQSLSGKTQLMKAGLLQPFPVLLDM